MVVDDSYKFCIDSFREKSVIFKFRAYLFNVQSLYIVDKDNTMRISHRYTSDIIFSVVDSNFFVDNLIFAVYCYGNIFGIEFCLTHIDTQTDNFTIFFIDFQGLDTAESLYCYGFLVGIDNVMVIQEFAYTADTVTAHFTLRTVQIEHTHFSVRYI